MIHLAPLAAMAVAVAAPALAHTGHGGSATGGFVSGLTHPLYGWDHMAAMVAVGLWGAFLGRPALWLLPIVFPMAMALAAATAIAGLPLPGVEAGIAGSAILLGLLIALAMRPPLWVASVVVGVFAVFHGHAHGTELPEAANPVAYAVGFVISTGLLHATGILLGLLIALPRGELAIRGGGGLISLAGAGFLLGVI
jgi:urease accessory protein